MSTNKANKQRTITVSQSALIAGATFTDPTVTSKAIALLLSGSVGTLSLAASHTSARTLTLPDATDTIAVLALAQTFSNKTIANPTITSDALFNSFIGTTAGNLKNGSYNAALGYLAMSSYNNPGVNTYNSAMGALALQALTTGVSVAASGYRAGATLTTGARCTTIGATADVATATATDAIALGYAAVAPSSTAVIGNAAVVELRNMGNGTCALGNSANKWGALYTTATRIYGANTSFGAVVTAPVIAVADITVTLPAATSSLATVALVESFTNKTITGVTNSVDANTLRFGSTYAVALAGAAPATGMLMTYNGTNGVWLAPGNLTGDVTSVALATTAVKASGNFAVTGILSTTNSTLPKMITLFDSGVTTSNTDNRFYGFGIAASTLRYQVDAVASSHVFLAATSATTSTTLMTIAGSGAVSVPATLAVTGRVTALSSISMNNQTANKVIALYEDVISTDQTRHDFYGFGLAANTLRYQVDVPGSSHVFYAATSATASTTLMTIAGSGAVSIPATLAVGGLSTFNGGASIDVNTNTGTTGSWINMPSGGLSGIGHGGNAVNAWAAYCNVSLNWFADSVAGDVVARNNTGSFRWSINAAPSALSVRLGGTFASAVTVNAVAASSTTYATGTASQSGTTVTGTGTAFTAAMVGGVIVWDWSPSSFPTSSMITAFVSATSLTVSRSQTAAAGTYTVRYGGVQIDSVGNVAANHVIAPAAALTVTSIVAGSAVLTGNDFAGTVTYTSTLGTAKSSAMFTLNFAVPYGVAPTVIIDVANAVTANASVLGSLMWPNVTTTGITFTNASGGPFAANTYKWSYIVVQ